LKVFICIVYRISIRLGGANSIYAPVKKARFSARAFRAIERYAFAE